MIASLGLAIIGVNTYFLVFGPQRKAIDFLFGTTKFKLGGTTITADKSGAIISASVVMVLLVLGLVKSRIGLGVRALTQNPEGAALVGIGRKQAAFAILIVSGALAGFAAVLLSQIFYPEPNIGYLPLLKGLIVALLGGLGSILGTVIAGSPDRRHRGRDDALPRCELGAPDAVRADRDRAARQASRRRRDPGGDACVTS